MAVIGFSFTKFSAEKSSVVRGKINISNNVAIIDVADANITMAQAKKGVKVKFAFTSKYDPAVGSLLIEGEVMLLEDAKVADDVLQNWQKSKALPKELMGGLLNHILDRSNIQALIMARDLGLPAPIPLPKVNVQATPTERNVEQKAAPKAEAKAEKKPKK